MGMQFMGIKEMLNLAHNVVELNSATFETFLHNSGSAQQTTLLS
jgi:hypothetical protein